MILEHNGSLTSLRAERAEGCEMAKMSAGDLKALLAAERYDALSAMAASKLSDERASALNYYMGNMSKDMPAPDGRSKAVAGVNSSDFQDLLGGGETGLITQDGSLRRMIFAPGRALRVPDRPRGPGQGNFRAALAGARRRSPLLLRQRRLLHDPAGRLSHPDRQGALRPHVLRRRRRRPAPPRDRRFRSARHARLLDLQIARRLGLLIRQDPRLRLRHRARRADRPERGISRHAGAARAHARPPRCDLSL